MKKSEAVLRISANLQKHENILKGYAKGSITLKCTCDNLAIYLLDELNHMGMLPPMLPIPEHAFQAPHEWEPEDE